jgi:hypothetical protein
LEIAFLMMVSSLSDPVDTIVARTPLIASSFAM